ncbi:MAG: hypothetical protein EOP51_33105 [Sphingobacteriales bacterium]|nr:MAG: hypothetical protein EOP51_33105 [Sphingobacteriales bacterium]
MKRIAILTCLTALVFSLNACKDETDTLDTSTIEDYSPFVVGKYITYRLDSLVSVNFGAALETRTYQVKYSVDAAITDANNRPSFRIVRFMKKPGNVWQADATFLATPTANGLEFVENNLRYIKLRLPIRDGYNWSGNTHIDTYSITSEVKYLADWDYTYDSVGVASTVGTFNLEDVIKVDQRDEIIGNPADPNSYSEINYSVEKYARGIGLVYRQFKHTEYQPPTGGGGGNFAEGTYGVTLTMIDHN